MEAYLAVDGEHVGRLNGQGATQVVVSGIVGGNDRVQSIVAARHLHDHEGAIAHRRVGGGLLMHRRGDGPAEHGGHERGRRNDGDAPFDELPAADQHLARLTPAGSPATRASGRRRSAASRRATARSRLRRRRRGGDARSGAAGRRAAGRRGRSRWFPAPRRRGRLRAAPGRTASGGRGQSLRRWRN